MNKILRNIIAIVAGWFLGSFINIILIQLGHALLPIEGLDPDNVESMQKLIPSLGPEYFIFPFLAHTIGTLTGATITGLISANNSLKFSMLIGVFFFLGGLIMAFKIPSPIWFIIADLTIAYIPMAWLGAKISNDYRKS